MRTSQRLTGRVAIITGAASGIGRATVELFAAEGAAVVAVDRPESAILGIYADQQRIAPLAVDVTAADAPQRMVALALEKFGGLDILFNNAGVITHKPALEHTPAEWQRTLTQMYPAHERKVLQR